MEAKIPARADKKASLPITLKTNYFAENIASVSGQFLWHFHGVSIQQKEEGSASHLQRQRSEMGKTSSLQDKMKALSHISSLGMHSINSESSGKGKSHHEQTKFTSSSTHSREHYIRFRMR